MKIFCNSVMLLLLYLFISNSLFRNVATVDINCRFETHDFDSIGSQYTCTVQGILNIYNKCSAINLVRGAHKYLKSNYDVTALSSSEDRIQYLPTNLGDKFKNLIAISLIYGRLKEIHQSDLKAFTKLRYFNLDENDIETLDEDLFKFNPLLEVIWFGGNKIKSIGYSTFDHLTKLRDLDLAGNICVSEWPKNFTSVALLRSKLKQTCFIAGALVNQLEKKASELSEGNLKLSVQVKSLNSTLKNLNDQFSKMEQESQQKIEESAIQLEENEKKLSLATAQLTESLKQKQEVLEQLKRLEENFKNTKSETLKNGDKFQKRIDQLETQLDVQQVNLTFIEEKFRNSEILSNKTSESLKELQSKLADLKKVESELRHNKSELEDRLETKEIDFENVTDILANYSIKLLDYEQKIRKLNQKYNETASKLLAINSDYAEQTKNFSNVTTDKEKLQNQLKNLTKKLEKSESEFEDLLALNKKLSQELSNRTKATEAPSENSRNSHSLELISIIIGLVLIAMLTVCNVVFAIKFYRQKTINLKPLEFQSLLNEKQDQREN